MEGPDLRRFPRTLLCCSVELGVGGKTLRLEEAVGNLSISGLFVCGPQLPVNTSVHVKIASVPPFEADGVVRFTDAGGVGIEFTALTEGHRQRLRELIAAFVPKETLGS